MSNNIIYNGLFKSLQNLIRPLPNASTYRGQVNRFRGYLYIFEVNNRIKVGHSNDIAGRIRTHNCNAFCYSGNELNKVTILKVFKNRYDAEKELIDSIIKSKQFTQLSSEWFAGNYDEIVEIARGLTTELDTEFNNIIKS